MQHDALAVTHRLLLQCEQRARQLLRRKERELERRIDVSRRDPLHAFQRFETALRLARLARLRAEALDEAHHVADLALLTLVQRLLLRELRRALLFERRVVAGVELRRALLDVHDAVHAAIEELAIVRDHQQRARVAAQPFFQPYDCVEVEVIGRLVEQQQVGAAHQRLREIEPHAPTAGERRYWPRFVGSGEAETVHQPAGPAARVVTAERGVAGVQFAEDRAGIFGFCSGHRCFGLAQLGIAVHYELDGSALRRIHFLRDMRDDELRRHVEVAGVRLQLPEDQREQARFAAAVGADDADLLTAIDREGRVGDQQPRAAAQGQAGKREHVTRTAG